MNKEVKIITNDKTINLTDFDNFMFLDYVENDVQIKTDTVEVNGVDGVLIGASTFAPFELELNFVFSGTDISDYHLFKSKLRSIIYQREQYYIWHSDMPGKKYAVLPSATEIEDLYSRSGKVTLKFSVFKGFSESVNTTDDEFFFESNWMFENGIPLDFDPKYHHTSSQFTIWNGSTDTIDPRNIHHQLQIKMNIKATDGFELVNYTTGDIFRYNKSISPSVDFVLSGVHAYYDNNKVGIDTNRGVITLAPGKNTLKIRGDVSSQNVVFKFPFIYR